MPLFLLLALAIPVAGAALPGSARRDGMRLFIQAAPPLAALAGIGLKRLIDFALSRDRLSRLNPLKASGVVVILLLLALTKIAWDGHPLQLS